MRNFIIYLITGLLLTFSAHAQNKKQLDSLYQIVRNFKKLEKPGNQAAKQFMDACGGLVSYHLRYQNADSIFYYAQAGKTIADKMGNIETRAGFLYYLAIGSQVANQTGDAIKYYQNSLQTLQKINSNQAQMMCSQIYNNLSIIYQEQANFNQAIENQILSLEIKEKMNNQAGIANSYNTLGNIYELKGDYALSLENHLKALKIRESLNDRRGLGASYLNIGNIYYLLGNPKTAVEYYQKSLLIRNELNDLRGKALILNNIGNCYKDLNQNDEAIEYYQQALAINEQIKNLSPQADNLSNLSIIYVLKKDYDQAIMYAEKALSTREKLNNPEGICISLINLGDVYYNKAEYDLAINYAQKSYNLAKLKDLKLQVKGALLILARSNYNKKDWQKAYEFQKEFIIYSDSLINESANRQITELQTKYETEKKEKEIELLSKQQKINELALKEQTALNERKQIALTLLAKEKELQTLDFEKVSIAKEAELTQITQAKKIQAIEFDKKEKERVTNINLLMKENTIKAQVIENQKLTTRNLILFSGLGILLVGSIVGYLFLRQRQHLHLETERRLRENIIHQFDTLKNQISPHFLLNSLTALHSLIGKSPEKAQNFTTEMAKVYRYVLELKDNLLVQLKEEIELSKAYISLQKMQFGDSLQISLMVSPQKMTDSVPPLSLQLLLENAIKHNDLDEMHPLKIDIKDEDEYLVVKNNLQQKSVSKSENSTHIGLKNLKERYRLVGGKEPIFSINNQECIVKISLIIS